MGRKRQAITPDLGKQLFGGVLDSLAGKQPLRSSGLEALLGGVSWPADAVRQSLRAALVAGTGERLWLDGSQALVGRRAGRRTPGPDVDLAPFDPLQSVSRRHAWIERDELGGYSLRVELDPPPTNPVLLDGEALQPGEVRRLSDGARIQIGLVELRFALDAS